jgi:Glycosyl transferase family 2
MLSRTAQPSLACVGRQLLWVVALLTCVGGGTIDSSISLSTPHIRVTACTIVRNELPYLIEWIEFHRLVGFHRLVVYDDNSTDGTHLLGQLYEQVHLPCLWLMYLAYPFLRVIFYEFETDPQP